MRSGLISLVQLSASGFEVFLELTGAILPDDLGDGEAATTAQSFDIGAIPVVDERKATRIALQYLSSQSAQFSIASIFWVVPAFGPPYRRKNSAT